MDRESAMAALFDRFYAPMCRLAYVILGDRGAAEEVVMDAMLNTFTGWRRMRDPGKADPYLRRAVVNGCRSRIRRRTIERKVNALAHARAGTAASPGWDVERHETHRLVGQAVRSLPDRQRACVVLRYYEDLSEAQIADTLDCSVGTVKSQLSKARAKLGTALGPVLGGGDG